MSITYEEALGTLTAMFTDPWDEDSLDTVLRHFEGHMENTVDAVLSHGDAPPADLLKRLAASKTGASIADMDEQLAREMAQQEQARSRTSRNANTSSVRVNRPAQNYPGSAPRNNARVAPSPTPATPTKKGRGTPTQLPPDFLRIPGVSTGSMSEDEALARMLQDKLFADEIRNNPEFAHLARGGGRATGFGNQPVQNRNPSGDQVLKALQGMGENAKKRFQDFANKVKQKIDEKNNPHNSSSPFGAGGGVAERRGLLDIHEDDDEQEISFVGGSGTHEMRSMDTGFAFTKKDD
jgi:hypothetical protein